MTTKEILIAARKLIEKPEHWTQETFARDADGKTVGYFEGRAVRWCASGAISRAHGTANSDSARVARAALLQVVDDLEVSTFNDSHTHAEVLAAFDRAIEAVTS